MFKPAAHWIALLLLGLLATTPGRTQSLPCGFFGWDRLETYSYWLDHGFAPDRPDFNGDGRLDVRDFLLQAGCVDQLGPGLLGQYYGFDTGSPEDIHFPDLATIPNTQTPAVILAAEQLEELESFAGFMDSHMRFQFAALFTGYLFVPETAEYTLHIFGDRGMRVSLDGQPILAFDTQPREDAATLSLTMGLHPIRVEYYAARTAGRILLDWSSNGRIIGPTPQTIGLPYLYHQAATVPPMVLSQPELHISPPSGGRVAEKTCAVDIVVTGPEVQYQLLIDGQPTPLLDGAVHTTLPLHTGLNTIPMTIVTGSGQTHTTDYHVYVDQEELTRPGVAASLYANEWARYPIPNPRGRIPFTVVKHSGAAISNNNEFSRVGGYQLSKDAVVDLEGAVNIPTNGWYQFKINGPGALYFNGEQICAHLTDYRDKNQPTGVVYLTEGYNHFHAYTGSSDEAPHFNVYWGPVDGELVPLHEDHFRYAPAHGYQGPLPQGLGSGGRHSDQLIAEYLFEAEAPWTDSSGFGSDLPPDPRAFVRQDGGLTYQSAGCLSSELAGTFLTNRAKQNRELSLEADFIPDQIFQDDQPRELVSLSTVVENYLARVYLKNNDLYFRVYDDNQVFEEVVAEDLVEPGIRLHVVGMLTPTTLRLMVNGSLFAEQAYQGQIRFWPSSAKFNVGQPYLKYKTKTLEENQMMGTFLVAATYSKVLSDDAVQTNCQANRDLRPTPPPLPAPSVETFPPAGVTPDQMAEAVHVLNRLTFGPSIESMTQILEQGVDAWIEQQLEPESINDDTLETLVNAVDFQPTHDELDLQAKALFHMIGSKRQLQEVMTWFWENHFNTQHTKVHLLNTEQAENDRFREHALGNFAELLHLSAVNYPMIVYLDNRTNVVGAPNENYAREFFELHTMGVNNGYTHDDILQASRVFTGWTVRDGEAFFNPGLHDYSAKSLVGLDLPAGGGQSDALLLINHMVTLRQTADFITWKLCQFFVADTPPAEIHQAASDAFFKSRGDIKTTLRTIFHHPQFRTDPAYRNNKVKTPLEFATSVCRLSEAFPLTRHMNPYLHSMGMKLFDYADPTGFPEESVAWIDTNANLVRWNMVNDLTSNRGAANTFGMNFRHFIQRRGLTTPEALMAFFDAVTVHGAAPEASRATIYGWLTNDDPGGFELNDDTLDNQVRQAFGLFLRLPEMNQQ